MTESARPKRLLLTGATGFVGSHLARRLAADGYELHLLVRPESDLSILDGLEGCFQAHVYRGDFASAVAALERARPVLAIHLASLFISEHTPADLDRLVDSNIRLGLHLLEAMRIQGVSKLLNTGTAWQHFQNADYNPVNLYAATKQAFEDLLEYYVRAHAFQALTLKLYDTYGPRDPRRKLMRLLRDAAADGRHLDLSPGEQLLDLVHIQDVTAAYGLAIERLADQQRAGHERFAVSSGSPLSLRELVGIFEEVTGSHLDITWGGRPYRTREVMRPWDNGRALPGWKPSSTLHEGIRKLIEEESA